MFCRKRSFLKFWKFHWKTSVLESLFNKAAGLKACSLIKKRLQHKCFPLKFAKFLKIPILKNICDNCFCTAHLVTVIVTYKSVIYSIKIAYKKTDEWYIEWERVVQRVTTNDNEWLFWLIFFVFRIREEPSIRHPKENPLNLEEDLEEDLRN